MGSMSEDQPLFDGVIKAVVFALNAHDVSLPAPYMSRAMSEVKVKPRITKKAKLAEERVTLGSGEGPLSLLERELNKERKWHSQPAQERVRGLDKAAQAGFILMHMGKLDLPHLIVLEGLYTTAYAPCDCQKLCCSGRTPNLRWLSAVNKTVIMLRESADVLKAPGKKGLSTNPQLRKRLVELYFTGEAQTLDYLAGVGGVTTVTAARHRDWVRTFLDQLKDEALTQIAEIFDQAGITGALE